MTAGRPRLEGDRYPSGQLKRPPAAPPTEPDATPLTFAQGEAARRYEHLFEVSQRFAKAERRMMAEDALRAARRALTGQEIAVLDLVVIKGRPIAQIASEANWKPAWLEHLYLSALTKLAAYFEGAND